MPQSFQGNQNEQNSHMLNIFAERHLLIHLLLCHPGSLWQGWGQVQYLYLSTYLSVLDVLEYLVYGNVKVLVLDQKVLGT